MSVDAELIEAVRTELQARADPVKAPETQRYMKSEMPYHGVQRAGQREVARAAFAAHPLDDFADWRDTILSLWHGATHREERYLAVALAGDRRYRVHRTAAVLPLYEELIVTGAWWDHVDAVAAGLIGELLTREHDAVARTLRAWSTDAHMWKRRSAIIAQVRLKDRTDVPLLYDCIEPNRADREFFIRKGIGWALRAYAWVDPDEIVRYCESHELTPLSRREALRNIERIRARS
jgi:3-methyladenine DNA glycosylase AlkD